MASPSQPNHQQQADELLHAQQLLRATLDSSMDMIQVFVAVRNEQAEIVDFTWILNNHASEKIYGDVLGKSLLQLQPGVVEEDIFAAFKHVVETGQPQQYEKHYVHEQFDGWFLQSIVKLGDGVATTTADITARKNAEQALQQSRALLQDVIDAPAIGIAVYKALRNEQGQIIDFVHEYINRASLTMLGGEDFTGKLFTDHGENGILQLTKLIEVVETGIGNSYLREAHFRGQKVWFAITNSPLGEDRLVHTWEDVTERQKAEQETKEQAHFIQSVTEMMPDVISVVEFPSRTILYTNRDTLSWIGFDADKLSGMSFEDRIQLFHPDDLPAIQDFYNRFSSLKDGQETSVEYRLKNKQGDWILLSLRGQVFRRDEEGTATQLLFVGQNITAQRKAEQEIRRLNEEIAQRATDKYRILFETMDEGFAVQELVFDQCGEIADLIYHEANAAFARHTGLAEASGKRASEVFPHIEPGWFDALKRVYQTGIPERTEGFNTDTGRWLTAHYSPVGGAGSPFIAAVFQDITQRKQREQHQAFLLHFSDTLRAEPDADAIANRALHLLAGHLQLDRCYVGVYLLAEDRGVFPYQVGNDQVPPMPKEGVRLSDFPQALRITFDETLIITDFQHTDGLTEVDKRNFALLGFGALVVATVRKGGKNPHWAINAVSARPRRWTDLEIELVEEVTERTWAAVEQAKAEKALTDSEAKYRTLFDSIDEGFCIVEVILDENGKPFDLLHLETNQAYERYTGLSGMAGKRSREIIPEAGPWLDFYGNVALTGQAARNESYLVAPINRWIAAYASRIGGEDSLKVAIVFDDITERKRRETNLAFLAEVAQDFAPLLSPNELMQRVGKRLAAHLHLSRLVFFEVDNPADRITAVYEWQRDNRTPSTLGSYAISTLLTPAGRQHYAAGKLAIIPDTRSNWTLAASPESLYESGNASIVDTPYLENGHWTFLLTLVRSEPGEWRSDETDLIEELASRIYIRLQRARAEQALQQANQRKDEFLAMLAHELRNPMATIRSGLTILDLTLTEEMGVGATVAPTVKMMNRQTEHLVRLVDDLLDVSRISRGKIELKKGRLNLVDLVRQAQASLQSQFEQHGKALQVQLPTAPIEVEGDATRLTQIVVNLLTNGLRYTGEGGQVWLSLSHHNKEAILQVRDNGIGLAKEQLSAIFELFVQVDNSLARSKGGLGVGLTLVNRLVELHGGQVEAQSDGIGRGSTFTVHLPTLTTATDEQVAKPAPPVTDSTPARRIVVIDDNADAAMTLAMLLKLKGYEAYARTSGQAGIEAAEALQPSAILLDIGMPELDGYATCALIRQQSWGKTMVVIALTGYGQEEDRLRTQEAGFDGHLVKPVDLATLLNLLIDLLDKGRKS